MNKLSSVLIARIRALNHRRCLRAVKLRPRLQALPAVRAILFDVYGTLVDSGAGPLQLGDEMVLKRRMTGILRQAGFSPCCRPAGVSVLDAWREKILIAHQTAHVSGIDYPELDVRHIWRQVLGLSIRRGWIKGTVNANVIARVALEFEGVQNPVALMPGIENALARLRQRGIKMGIVSNAQFYTPLILQVLFSFAEYPVACHGDEGEENPPKPWRRRVGASENFAKMPRGFLLRQDFAGHVPRGASFGASLAKIGFDRSLCIWSYRLGRAKPSPRLLNLALKCIGQKYGLRPREVLVIGNDWDNDLAPARRFGCRTALLAGSKRSFSHPENAARPDLLLTHWSQLDNIWIKNHP